jgi:hypothetical protein
VQHELDAQTARLLLPGEPLAWATFTVPTRFVVPLPL